MNVVVGKVLIFDQSIDGCILFSFFPYFHLIKKYILIIHVKEKYIIHCGLNPMTNFPQRIPFWSCTYVIYIVKNMYKFLIPANQNIICEFLIVYICSTRIRTESVPKQMLDILMICRICKTPLVTHPIHYFVCLF